MVVEGDSPPLSWGQVLEDGLFSRGVASSAVTEKEVLALCASLEDWPFGEALEDVTHSKGLEECSWSVSSPENSLASKILDASDHVCKSVGPLGMGEEEGHFRRTALDPFGALPANLIGGYWEVKTSGELEVESELDPADSALVVGRGFGARVGDPA